MRDSPSEVSGRFYDRRRRAVKPGAGSALRRREGWHRLDCEGSRGRHHHSTLPGGAEMDLPTTMRAMVLEKMGEPLRMQRRRCPFRSRGPGRCCCGCAPAGSAGPTCTSSTGTWRAGAAADSGAPDRRGRGGAGRGRGGLRGRRPGRGALAGVHLRDVPLLRAGAGEPVRQRAVHGLRPRRRIRRVHGRLCEVLLPPAGRLRRHGGRAAALRGADRLPHLPAGGGRR